MKRKLLIPVLFACGAAAGCSEEEPAVEPTVLEAPVPVGREITQVGFEVVWEAVENAASYLYALDEGELVPLAGTTVRLEGLEPARRYTVRVQAVAGDELHLDSRFGQTEVTTLPATALSAPKLAEGAATENSATVEWQAVAGAGSYVYAIDDGQEQSTPETFVRVEGLESGMPAIVRVKAAAEDVRYLDSEFAEIVVAAAMEAEPFVITGEVLDGAIRVEIAPKSPTRSYLSGCVARSEYDAYESEAAFIESLRRKFEASALIAGTDYAAYLASRLVQGSTTAEFTKLKAETEYLVYVVGWDVPTDRLTTVLVTQSHTTPSAAVAGEVTVEFANVTTEGFDVVCTPDETIEKYYVYVVKTSALTLEQLLAGGLEEFKKNVMTTKDEYTGNQTIPRSGLAAGTRYTVCVLGIGKNGMDFYAERSQATEKAQ